MSMPPLGHEIAPGRRCTRCLSGLGTDEEVLCGEPAVEHIDWGPHLGFVCEKHREEALTRWTARAHHSLGAQCGMPGSVWVDLYDGGSKCLYDELDATGVESRVESEVTA